MRVGAPKLTTNRKSFRKQITDQRQRSIRQQLMHVRNYFSSTDFAINIPFKALEGPGSKAIGMSRRDLERKDGREKLEQPRRELPLSHLLIDN